MSKDETPERVMAALRGWSNETVAHLGIACDMGSCEEMLDGDFLVPADADRPTRYETIFRFAQERGWEIFRKMNVAYCPEHAGDG